MKELADAINNVATQIKYLGNGNASTEFGALEALGSTIKEGLESVAGSISELAEAVRDSK